MKNTLSFLGALHQNNNRDWFEAHRADYTAVLSEFNALTEELIRQIGRFDPDIRDLTVKDCTYRIYRDIRFSSDKTPYKTYMGAYLCRGGKKSEYAGYYLHVEPKRADGSGGHFLTAGLYMPENYILKSVREEMLDNSRGFLESAKKAAGFTLTSETKLKRLPVGYPAGTEMDEYLRMKDIFLSRPVDDAFLTEGNLAEKAAAAFRTTKEFTDLLNRAVEYAIETKRENR